MLKYSNFIIILSAPSGAGKSTLTKKLLEWQKNIKLSISATTRSPRGEEKNGFEYYFLTKEEFEEKIKNNEFIEYAEVHGNYYGTLKSQMEENFKNDNDVILDVDWQGGRAVSDQFDLKRLLKIFILPPSIKELDKRLRGRGTDGEEVINKRIAKARDEILHFNEYEYVIINDDINEAFEQIKAVILAKRLKNITQESMNNFVEKL